MTNTPHSLTCPVHNKNIGWSGTVPPKCTCAPTPRTWEEDFRKKFPFAIIDWKAGAENDGDVVVTDKMKEIIAEIRTIEDEAVRRTRDNFIGLIVKNSTGFDTINGKRLWHVDIDAVEKDLLNDN